MFKQIKKKIINFIFINSNKFRSAGISIYELITFKRPFYNLRQILSNEEFKIEDKLEIDSCFKIILSK